MVSWRRALVRTAVGFTCLTGICHADEWDTFNLRAAASHHYDSNLFRDASDESSDRITSISAGANIDKPFGQQRLRMDGSLTRNYYAKNSDLDHTNKDYETALEWSLTPRLTGTLSMGQVQRLADFSLDRTTNSTDRNLLTVRSKRFDADWWMHSNWHLLFGVGRDDRDYETDDIEEDRNSRSIRWLGGLRYDAGGGRTLTADVRVRDGEYERDMSVSRFRDDEFDEMEYGLLLAYALGGDSRLIVRAAYFDHEEPNVAHRDFSGWTGFARFQWGLTAKTEVNLGYEYDLRPWQNQEGSYASVGILSAGVRWSYTVKQSLELLLKHQTRDQEGRLPTAEFPVREDRTRSAGLYWTWKPNLTTVVKADATYTRRDSSGGDPSNDRDYDVHGVGLSVVQTF